MNCIKPYTIWPHRSINYKGIEEPFQVPCGKCIPCLMNRRTDWSFRIQQEWKVSKSAFFVTLTYDRKHCPSDGSLRKRDFQLYMKRLRKMDGTNTLRYYAVGEYGSKTGRPHYHALIFNSVESQIRSAWRDSKGKPIGIVHIGNVTEASVAYTLKYMVQPWEETGDEREKPFALMSRKYGIGAHYLTDEMVQWHRDGRYNYTMRHGSVGRLPRFYRDKIWPNVKTRIEESRYSEVIAERWRTLRKRISDEARKLVEERQKKELAYYRKKYGERAEAIMLQRRDAVLAGVKKKVAFSQQF